MQAIGKRGREEGVRLGAESYEFPCPRAMWQLHGMHHDSRSVPLSSTRVCRGVALCMKKPACVLAQEKVDRFCQDDGLILFFLMSLRSLSRHL